MTPAYCSFCGRMHAGVGDYERDLPIYRSRLNHPIAICCYCARAAIRGFGEVPDPSDGVVALRPRLRAVAGD